MFHKSFLIISILFLQINLFSQEKFPSYFNHNDMELATPGSTLFGLGGFDNPAELAFIKSTNFYFTWNDKDSKFNDFNNWGMFTSIPYLGFAINNKKADEFSITDYKLSTGIGNGSFGIGMGFGWSSGNVNYFNRSDLFTLGAIFRPSNYLSFSLIGNLPTNGEREGIIGLGLRPLGSYPVTIFGDYVFSRFNPPEKINWSAGAIVESLDGLRLAGRYFEGKSFNVAVQIGFGSLGLTSIGHFDSDKKHAYTTYGIRIGGADRNILGFTEGTNNYASLNLLGGIKYQSYRLFDNSKTLFNLLEQLDAVKTDKGVTGIAINLSGANINREMLWELREKLAEIKSYNKKIYVFIDRAGIDEYQLASVADKIVLDPVGSISLNGYMMGRTFLKGTLDKLGIGFHELRFFKYKSAVESYSRDSFSEADREQRQRLVDENYDLAKKNICAGRNFTAEYFDRLVDSTFMFLPDDAVNLKLVDTLARWSDIGEIIKKFESENKKLIDPLSLNKFTKPDDYWGSKPKVAVIYAIGGTSMDDGIKARSLVGFVEAAVNNSNIKAIVLRVDSPGGDGLASDLIAEALKKGKGKKPIIVSQGYVAASGGYWLSMYADTIVAAPNTITGSIGVISGFVFNKTAKQEIGLSTDFVKKGKFADLGFGATVPFIGISLPDRDFTEEEFALAENGIKRFYKSFVEKVAAGRNKSYDEIEKIAQGRVWSGTDGLKNGLVDVIGGLSDAIKIALQKADLLNKEYEIIEMPEREWFDFSSLMPSFLRFEQKIVNDPFIQELKFRAKYNAIPLPLLPSDYIDDNMIFEE